MPVNCSSQDKLPTILIPTTSHQDLFFYDVRMSNLFISIDLSGVPVYKTTRRYNKKAVILVFATVTILFFIIYIRFFFGKFYTVTKQICPRQNKHIPKKRTQRNKVENRER
jgi:hypothetical protein